MCLWSWSQSREKIKKIPLIPPSLSPSHQVRKTSEHSPLPPTFAHWLHSCPETQYLTIDKQLTHLFFWGTRWLALSPVLAALAAWEPAETETKRDNLLVKPQTAIKLLHFTIRSTESWLTVIPKLSVFFSNNGDFWHAPARSSLPVNNPCLLEMHEKPLMQPNKMRWKVILWWQRFPPTMTPRRNDSWLIRTHTHTPTLWNLQYNALYKIFFSHLSSAPCT